MELRLAVLRAAGAPLKTTFVQFMPLIERGLQIKAVDMAMNGFINEQYL